MGLYKIPKIIGIDRKPSFGARINWHHPLSQGLVGTWLLNEYSGLNVFNPVKMDYGNIVSATWVPDGLDFGVSTNQYYIQMSQESNYRCIDAFSSFSIFNSIDLSATAKFQAILAKRNAVGDENNINYELRVGKDYAGHGPGFVSFNYRTGGTWNIWDTYNNTILYNNTWHSLGISFKYGTGTSMLCFVDGINKTALGSWKLGTGASASADSSLNTVRIGDSNQGTAASQTSFGGKIKLVFLWNRALTVSELQSLHVNPYQMFWHPMKDIYIVPAAAPPPSGGRSIFGYDSIFHAGGIIQT